MAESSLDGCLQQNSHYNRIIGYIYIARPDYIIIVNQCLNRLTEIVFCAHYIYDYLRDILHGSFVDSCIW